MTFNLSRLVFNFKALPFTLYPLNFRKWFSICLKISKMPRRSTI